MSESGVNRLISTLKPCETCCLLLTSGNKGHQLVPALEGNVSSMPFVGLYVRARGDLIAAHYLIKGLSLAVARQF